MLSSPEPVTIHPVVTRADADAFVDLPWALYADDPYWVPPLKSEVHDLIGGPKSNPWFLHAEAAFFLARRGGQVVGRISAQVCQLVQARRPGLGQWGMLETVDDPAIAAALFAAAEDWLRARGMHHAQGPISLSIWDEPGLLVDGFETRPIVMMGHHRRWYAGHVAAAGYAGAKDLHQWEVGVTEPFPPLVNRIVAMGEKNPRIRVRGVDLKRFDAEARVILGILNRAWGENWGFVPLTDAEVAYVGKKLKPIVYPDMVLVAELDGDPVAFMLTIPDLNQHLRDLDGRLFPFGWAKLLWRLKFGRVARFRVPLMGVVPELQGSRMASMIAMMMIEETRRANARRYAATHAEIGWILEDNGPMNSIAEAIEARIIRTYRIYEKPLSPPMHAAPAAP